MHKGHTQWGGSWRQRVVKCPFFPTSEVLEVVKMEELTFIIKAQQKHSNPIVFQRVTVKSYRRQEIRGTQFGELGREMTSKIESPGQMQVGL